MLTLAMARDQKKVYVGATTETGAKREARFWMEECEAPVPEYGFVPPAVHAEQRERVWRLVSGREGRRRLSSEWKSHWRKLRRHLDTRSGIERWSTLQDLYGRFRTAQVEENRDRLSRELMENADEAGPTKRQLERMRARLRRQLGSLDRDELAGVELVPEQRCEPWRLNELVHGTDPRKRRRMHFDTPAEILMDYFHESLSLRILTSARLTHEVLVWYIGRSERSFPASTLEEWYRRLRSKPEGVPGQP